MKQIKGPKRAASQFLTFALVGSIGFVVDGGILSALAAYLSFDVYLSRLVSFSSATIVTWALNRIFTFRRPNAGLERGRAREYASYLAIQILGALINLGIFSYLIWRHPPLKAAPIIPLAAGALVALFFNFLASRHFVFRLAHLEGNLERL